MPSIPITVPPTMSATLSVSSEPCTYNSRHVTAMSAIDETNKNKRHWVRIARHAALSENPRLRMDRDAKQKPDSDSAKHSALQKSTPYIPLISPAPKATAYRCRLNAERQRRFRRATTERGWRGLLASGNETNGAACHRLAHPIPVGHGQGYGFMIRRTPLAAPLSRRRCASATSDSCSISRLRGFSVPSVSS